MFSGRMAIARRSSASGIWARIIRSAQKTGVSNIVSSFVAAGLINNPIIGAIVIRCRALCMTMTDRWCSTTPMPHSRAHGRDGESPTRFQQACVMRDQRDGTGQIVHKWRLIRRSASQPWELYDVQADKLERTNLLKRPASGRLDELTHSLESAYEVWWRKVSAHASEYSRPVIGSPSEPVVCL